MRFAQSDECTAYAYTSNRRKFLVKLPVEMSAMKSDPASSVPLVRFPDRRLDIEIVKWVCVYDFRCMGLQERTSISARTTF